MDLVVANTNSMAFIQYADSRTAYDDLTAAKKEQIKELVANHSLFHSRKTVMPDYFKDTDPSKLPLSKHKLSQLHEWSGRKVLSIPNLTAFSRV